MAANLLESAEGDLYVHTSGSESGSLVTDEGGAPCCCDQPPPPPRPGFCCDDRGTLANPIPARCSIEPISGCVTLILNGFVEVTTRNYFMGGGIPFPFTGTWRMPLDNISLCVNPSVGCNNRLESLVGYFPGTGESISLWIEALTQSPSGGPFGYQAPPSYLGGIVGSMTSGRAAIFEIALSVFGGGRGRVTSHVQYMAIETLESQAIILAHRGPGDSPVWELSLPAPVGGGQCALGIVSDTASIVKHVEPNFLRTVFAVGYDWRTALTSCRGDSPAPPPTTCERCGGELQHISHCKAICKRCGLTSGGCG